MGSGLFKTSVFPVPAGESRTVVLHYSQICRTLHGVSDYLLPLTTARYTERPIEKFSLTVHLTSSADLKNIYSPNHQVSVERDGARRAKVTYQRQQWIPDSDFRLLFDAGDGPVSGKLLSYRAEKDDQGYFAFFATPDLPQTAVAPVSKTVLLVVDRSGSMSGQKMEQARESLRFVLNHLHDGDLFNVIAYDSVVESFRAELQRYGDSTREEAIGFVNGLHAGGSTNINGALQAALSQLHDKQQPTYIVFLTDGIPTVGPTSVAEIAKNAQAANQVRARMFCFGVGYDVNSRLLDRLSRDNFGNTSFVRPNEQIEGAVSKLYEQIESPVLTNAKLYVASPERAVEQGASIDRMYPGSPFDLFAGQQLMVVGRSRITGDATLVIEGQVNGTAKRYEFPVHFSDAFTDSTNSFVARLWAIRRVGDLLDMLDIEGKNEELIHEIVTLATQHGIVTPYTSFLAEENDHAPNVALQRERFLGAFAKHLSADSGPESFEGRADKLSIRQLNTLDASDQLGRLSGRDSGVASGEASSMSGVVNAPTTTAVQGPMHVAGRTLYFRSQCWVDAALTDEEQRTAQQLVRFSDEFFRLLERHGEQASKLLSIDGDIVVQLGDTVYKIVNR